jgi:hypothetical protein
MWDSLTMGRWAFPALEGGGVGGDSSSWCFFVSGHMMILSISVMIRGKLFHTVSRSGSDTYLLGTVSGLQP